MRWGEKVEGGETTDGGAWIGKVAREHLSVGGTRRGIAGRVIGSSTGATGPFVHVFQAVKLVREGVQVRMEPLGRSRGLHFFEKNKIAGFFVPRILAC